MRDGCTRAPCASPRCSTQLAAHARVCSGPACAEAAHCRARKARFGAQPARMLGHFGCLGLGCSCSDRRAGAVQVLQMLGAVAGKRVVELGAGIGRFTGALAGAGAASVLAVDFMEHLVAENRRVNGHWCGALLWVTERQLPAVQRLRVSPARALCVLCVAGLHSPCQDAQATLTRTA